MTEDEAKTKWCPFALVLLGMGGSANRDGTGQTAPTACCIGSGCMMWRQEAVAIVDNARVIYGNCGLARWMENLK